MTAQPQTRFSEAEYLRLERASAIKHECSMMSYR